MENVTSYWINPVPDIDRKFLLGQNLVDLWLFGPAKFLRKQDWIRSGMELASRNDPVLSPYHFYGDISLNGEPLDPGGTDSQQTPQDENEVYEFNGSPWLVPYQLVSSDYRGRISESSSYNIINSIDTIGGGLAWKDWKSEIDFNSLINVDVILTPDQDLWTSALF